jgi:serine kinase of HPr protein (carbohydrate metabolism regulator)
MTSSDSTIHASAVLVGAHAVLIRGPSGSGKSQLAWQLINARLTQLPFACLVGDDRVFVEAHHGRLIVRPAPALAGLLEIRGAGIRRLPYEPFAIIGLVVDLGAADADRLPAQQALWTEILGITLPRFPAAASHPALPAVLAMLGTTAVSD